MFVYIVLFFTGRNLHNSIDIVFEVDKEVPVLNFWLYEAY